MQADFSMFGSDQLACHSLRYHDVAIYFLFKAMYPFPACLQLKRDSVGSQRQELMPFMSRSRKMFPNPKSSALLF
jgi:hypothetical protein